MLPQTGKGKDIGLFKPYKIRLFGFGRVQPLKKSECRNQAATLPESGPEGGLAGNAFRPGINHLITDFLILGPERNETPFEHDKLTVRCAGNKPHRRNVLRWSDIISWFKAGRFLEVEMTGQFFWCWQGKAAAHDASQSQVE